MLHLLDNFNGISRTLGSRFAVGGDFDVFRFQMVLKQKIKL
jgi:hypothetical protein